MPYKQMIEEVLVNLRDLIKRRTEQIGKGQYIRYVCDGRKDPKGPRIYPPVTRNDAILTEGKGYIPVGGDNNVHSAEPIQNVQNDAATAAHNLIPTAGNIAEIQLIRVLSSATAAGRGLNIRLTDATRDIDIWESGAGGVAGGDDYVVFPVDLSNIYVPSTQAWGFPLTVHAGTYLTMTSTGLMAAETHDVYVHWKVKRVAGFE